VVAQTPTPNTSTDTGPLDWRIAITDSGGRPTPEFQRRWNTQRNNNDLIGATVDHGPPTGIPISDGLVYIDEDTTPPTEYVSEGGNWVKVGVYKFTDLSDVPHDYTSKGGDLVEVNSVATGLDFVTLSAKLDSLGAAQGDILYRSSTGWVTLTPGTSGNVLTTHGTSANPTWTAPAASGVTSVAMTVPSILSVSGSPITTSGTLAVSLATQSSGLFFAGPTSGGAAAPTFRFITPGDLPVATGSTFGIVKPDGTTITISGGVISSSGGGGTPANPTATASDTAVNGSATTYMRSDAAPAVQKASSSQFGLVKVDGTSITASGGVISAAGGGSGAVSHFGVGAPSTLATNGDLYFDTTSVPYQGYVQDPSGAMAAAATVRGSSGLATSANPAVITFPGSAIAGDEAFIFVGGGWSVPSAPSGWTQIDNEAGSNFNGFIAHRTLTSGDITTGSVSVTLAGTFDLYAACLVVEGPTYGGIRGFNANRSGSSTPSDVLITSSSPITSDLVIYFGSQRGSSLPVVNQGTQLQQQTNSSSGAGVLAAGNPGSAGPITATFTYPSPSNGGIYDAIVVVEGVSGGAGWVKFS
jgi:hypothetical protein